MWSWNNPYFFVSKLSVGPRFWTQDFNCLFPMQFALSTPTVTSTTYSNCDFNYPLQLWLQLPTQTVTSTIHSNYDFSYPLQMWLRLPTPTVTSTIHSNCDVLTILILTYDVHSKGDLQYSLQTQLTIPTPYVTCRSWDLPWLQRKKNIHSSWVQNVIPKSQVWIFRKILQGLLV